MLKQFDLSNSKLFGTLMSPSLKLNSDLNGKKVDVTLYGGMIGNLLYLITSKPDIMLSVCLCTRYQVKPKESHLLTIKRIMRYLMGTSHLGLWYPKSNTYSLVGYLDMDFTSSRTNKKSTIGSCQFIGHSLVSWQCKKQNNVALSTVEAKYIIVESCCTQLLWMK